MRKNKTYIYSFVNSLVKRGNRSKAYKFFHNALAALKFQKDIVPITVIRSSFNKLKPIIKVLPFKRGSKSRYLPLIISPNSQRRIVVKWLLSSLETVSRKNLSYKISNIFYKTFKDKGSALDKKVNYYKLGVQNKRTLKSLRYRRFRRFSKFKRYKRRRRFKLNKLLWRC